MPVKALLPKSRTKESSTMEARPLARKSPRNRLSRMAANFRQEEGLAASTGGGVVMMGGAEDRVVGGRSTGEPLPAAAALELGGRFGSSAWFTVYHGKLWAK